MRLESRNEKLTWVDAFVYSSLAATLFIRNLMPSSEEIGYPN